MHHFNSSHANRDNDQIFEHQTKRNADETNGNHHSQNGLPTVFIRQKQKNAYEKGANEGLDVENDGLVPLSLAVEVELVSQRLEDGLFDLEGVSVLRAGQVLAALCHSVGYLIFLNHLRYCQNLNTKDVEKGW